MTQWWNEQERLRALCEERDAAVNGLAIANGMIQGLRAEIVLAEVDRDGYCEAMLTAQANVRTLRTRIKRMRNRKRMARYDDGAKLPPVTVEIHADLTGFRQAMEEVDAELRSVRRRVDDLHEPPGDGGHGAEPPGAERVGPALHGRGRRGPGRPGDRPAAGGDRGAAHGGSPALRYYLDCPLHGTLATLDEQPAGGWTCWIWMHHLGRGYDYCRRSLRVVRSL